MKTMLLNYSSRMILTHVCNRHDVNVLGPSQCTEVPILYPPTMHETRQEIRSRLGTLYTILPQCSAGGRPFTAYALNTSADSRMLRLKDMVTIIVWQATRYRQQVSDPHRRGMLLHRQTFVTVSDSGIGIFC